MVTPKLLTYIKIKSEKGTQKKEIVETLQEANWSIEDISNAFNQIGSPLTKQEKQIIKTDRIKPNAEKNNSAKQPWIKIVGIIALLLGIGLLISTFEIPLKKDQDLSSIENQQNKKCITDADCDNGVCIPLKEGYVCSEGLIDDPCYLDSDCLSGHCPDNYCTEGTEGDPCFLSFDCEEPLMCTNEGICQ